PAGLLVAQTGADPEFDRTVVGTQRVHRLAVGLNARRRHRSHRAHDALQIARAADLAPQPDQGFRHRMLAGVSCAESCGAAAVKSFSAALAAASRAALSSA